VALRALIFDLDGTLLDSDGDIAAAANVARAVLDLPPMPVAEVARAVGWGLGHLLEQLLPGATSAQMSAAREAFVAHYAAHPLVHSQPLPGAEDLLAAVPPGHPLALVTNKPMVFVRPILAGLGWDTRFAVVVGGDTLSQRKPDPAPLLHALAGLGMDAADALYVGDSEVDAATAVAAGVDYVNVGWGRNAGQAAHTVPRLDALLDHPLAQRG
jgi:phosphoglycolate phosphatase